MSSNARAAKLVVDPDAFSVGTDISAAYAGVVLSAFGSGGVNGPDVSGPQVFSRMSPHASTGNRVFGNVSYTELWFADSAEFRADFVVPAQFVSLDFISDDGFDPAVLRAYSASGALLAEALVGGNLGVGVAETASIARSSGDIAYVVATNPAGVFGQQFLIDRLVFESRDLINSGARLGALDRTTIVVRNEHNGADLSSVPEPSSLSLAGLTLAVGLARRCIRAKSVLPTAAHEEP